MLDLALIRLAARCKLEARRLFCTRSSGVDGDNLALDSQELQPLGGPAQSPIDVQLVGADIGNAVLL